MDRLLKWTTWMCLWMGLPGLFTGLLPSPPGGEEAKTPPAELIDIQAQRQPDLLRLQFTTTQPVKLRHFKRSKPTRLVLELSPCSLGITQTPELPEGIVTDFRFYQINATTRVVMGIPESATFRIYPSAQDQRVWKVDLLDDQNPQSGERHPRAQGLPLPGAPG